VESLVTYIISHELHLAFGGFRKPNSQLWLGCLIPWQGKKVLSMVLDSEIDFELLVAYFEVEKTKFHDDDGGDSAEQVFNDLQKINGFKFCLCYRHL